MRSTPSLRRSWIAIGVAVVSFLMYLPTIATHVSWTDCGELAAAAVTFGIPHPTGYPLLAIVSRTWLLLPLPGTSLVRLNVLSALFVSAAMGVMFLAIRRMLLISRGRAVDPRIVDGVAAGAVLLLASSATVWDQSASYEVYALHLLLAAIVLFASLRALELDPGWTAEGSRRWVILAYVLGLAFANHMTTVLLVPPIIAVVIERRLRGLLSGRRLLMLALAGGTAVTLYAVLWLRARAFPPLDWGGVDSFEALVRHVSGKQYQVWMFAGSGVFQKNIAFFFGRLPEEFAWPVLLIALFGGVAMFRQSRTAGVLALTLLVTTVAYAANYDIHEIEPYFLGAYIAIAFAVAFGLRSIAEIVLRSSSLMRWGGVVLLLGTIGWQAVRSGKDAREVHGETVEAFARKVLDDVEPNAVIVTERWDYLYSPALYLRIVGNLRPDVKLIDHSLLRDRSWYVEQIAVRDTVWGMGVVTAADAFLLELRKFESGQPFAAPIIQMRWDALKLEILKSASRMGPVYVDMRLAGMVPPGWTVVPEGLLLRVAPEGTKLLYVGPPQIPPISGGESVFLQDLRSYDLAVIAVHSRYLRSVGRAASADSLVDRYRSSFLRSSG